MSRPYRHIFALALGALGLLFRPCALHALIVDPEQPANGPGAVVAAHPLAAEAGAAVLREGGTAADATIAAAMVLAVVEPQASGLGGGGFALVRSADGSFESLDFREQAPRALDPAAFFDPADSLHAARSRGGKAVAVPGTPAGLALLHERHGRLPLARLVAPAIHLARNGYPVSRTLSSLIAERAELFLGDSAFASLFLLDGLPPMEGDSLRNPALAQVLEEIGQEGFGVVASRHGRALSEAVREAGGWLVESDLTEYRALLRKPIRSQWRGLELVGASPPASGALAVMQALEILEPLDLAAMPEARRMHVVAEALRKALRDRSARCADPAFYNTPVDSLLNEDLARACLAQIHGDGIHAVWPALGSTPVWEDEPGRNPRDKGNTTHLSVWDGQGGVVSLTQSINYFFGAGVMAHGILLNNQVDDFSWDEGSPNLPAPGKRPRSSMAPMIVQQDGQPILCLGTPGGLRIPSTMTGLLIGHLQLGLGLQEAIDAPRCYPAGTTLVIEPRFPPATNGALEAIGYRLYPMGPMDSFFGGAHGIRRLPDGSLMGAADGRRDGAAVLVEPRP
jgi:gamma-glutamyltranspeptidase/glutathione hydrolase